MVAPPNADARRPQCSRPSSSRRVPRPLGLRGTKRQEPALVQAASTASTSSNTSTALCLGARWYGPSAAATGGPSRRASVRRLRGPRPHLREKEAQVGRTGSAAGRGGASLPDWDRALCGIAAIAGQPSRLSALSASVANSAEKGGGGATWPRCRSDSCRMGRQRERKGPTRLCSHGERGREGGEGPRGAASLRTVSRVQDASPLSLHRSDGPKSEGS